MAFAEELVKLGKELDFVIFEDRKFADIGGVIYLFVDIAFLPLFPLFSCPSSSFALLHCFCADLGSFSNPSSPKLELTFLLVIQRPLFRLSPLPTSPANHHSSPPPLPIPLFAFSPPRPSPHPRRPQAIPSPSNSLPAHTTSPPGPTSPTRTPSPAPG